MLKRLSTKQSFSNVELQILCECKNLSTNYFFLCQRISERVSFYESKKTEWSNHFSPSFDIFVFDSFFQRTYLYPASADDNHNPSFQNDCSKGRKEKYEEIFFWRESFLEDDLLAFFFFDFLPFLKKFLFCVLLLSHPISGSASVILELCCCGSNLS